MEPVLKAAELTPSANTTQILIEHVDFFLLQNEDLRSTIGEPGPNSPNHFALGRHGIDSIVLALTRYHNYMTQSVYITGISPAIRATSAQAADQFFQIIYQRICDLRSKLVNTRELIDPEGFGHLARALKAKLSQLPVSFTFFIYS